MKASRRVLLVSACALACLVAMLFFSCDLKAGDSGLSGDIGAALTKGGEAPGDIGAALTMGGTPSTDSALAPAGAPPFTKAGTASTDSVLTKGAALLRPSSDATLGIEPRVAVAPDWSGLEPVARPLGYVNWQPTGDLNPVGRQRLARIFSPDIHVAGQGYAAGLKDPARQIPAQAANCAAFGFDFQPYILSRLVTPEMLSKVAWPANVHRVMFDSELKQTPATYKPLRDQIPARILVLAPEHYDLNAPAAGQYGEYAESWQRVDGFGKSQRRVLTGLPMAVWTAKKYGIPIEAGPQLFNVSYNRAETDANLRSAVYLVAQASLAGAEVDTDIVCWGADDVPDATLQTVADAIREVNGLRMPAMAKGVKAQVAALSDVRTGISGYQTCFVKEMLVRSNVPHDIVLASECPSDTSRYKVLFVPHLDGRLAASNGDPVRPSCYAAIEAFAAAGGVVICECAESKNGYGTTVPPWAKVLPGARTNPDGSRAWYPTFAGATGQMGDGYVAYRDLLVAAYRAELATAGIAPCSTEPNIIAREFTVSGARYLWKVDTVKGTQEILLEGH